MTALDTGTEDLLAEIDDGVAVITMNRPSRRNALSRAMLSALADVLALVEADDAVGCVVLTGASGAFCAGGDVKGMASSPADGIVPVLYAEESGLFGKAGIDVDTDDRAAATARHFTRVASFNDPFGQRHELAVGPAAPPRPARTMAQP